MEKNSTRYIWVIGPDSTYFTRLCHRLSLNPDYELRRFTTLPLAQACRPAAGQLPHALLADVDNSPEALWQCLLHKLHERYPHAAVFALANQVAAEPQPLPFAEYLEKNSASLDHLWKALAQVRHQPPPPATPAEVGSGQLLGTCTSMQQVRELMAKAARTGITVSVTGETGTGKELVAQGIHAQSARRAAPFVAINMAAIPRELLESELFGHEKGAFTGAMARRIGRFEEASGGTLFLDEIADLEMPLQAKLLRVLQERSLTRVGGQQPVPFDVRLVVATHHDLAAEVQAGRFREDLYYRLLGLPIELPPLRQRGPDILLLAEAFVQQFSQLNGLPVRALSPAARLRLLHYTFPGNVRELKAVVELAAVLAEGNQLEETDIRLRASPAGMAPAPVAPGGPYPSLREQTLAIMQHSLNELRGDVVAAANRLRVGRSTLYRLIQSGHLRLPVS
ncbi:MAG: sigma-54 interaction domain-containing protein [Janthinobacterium lividum]